MKSRLTGGRTLATGVAAGATAAFWGASSLAADLVGQPTPGAIDLQPGVTPLRNDAIFFHNAILLPIITAIVLLVLGLLVWCALRFNKRANPVPSRFSHNTALEVTWTLLPVLILVVIAIFSFKLLFAYHDMPRPDLTIKATGYQWYWGYEYPDQKIPEFVSNVLPEDQAKARGVPYRLASTNPLVVPVNENVRVLVTGADVIHGFGIPSLGVLIDAIPGRVNQTWFRAERTGTFYGQCRELCGIDHAFMPIEVKVVTRPEFDAWVASKHGAPAAATPTAEAAVNGQPAAAAPAAPAAAPNNPAAPAPAGAPATAPASPAPTAPAAH
jgi:cytochrome c oxidase subunit 2